ncbi:MAG: hypothetical protein ACI9GM_001672 [Salibacteraceae bacterium]|jgi:hypothetical protein
MKKYFLLFILQLFLIQIAISQIKVESKNGLKFEIFETKLKADKNNAEALVFQKVIIL